MCYRYRSFFNCGHQSSPNYSYCDLEDKSFCIREDRIDWANYACSLVCEDQVETEFTKMEKEYPGTSQPPVSAKSINHCPTSSWLFLEILAMILEEEASKSGILNEFRALAMDCSDLIKTGSFCNIEEAKHKLTEHDPRLLGLLQMSAVAEIGSGSSGPKPLIPTTMQEALREMSTIDPDDPEYAFGDYGAYVVDDDDSD